MGFNPPVPQQDSNWEIRVALLLSLLLQVLLIFLGPMRKRSASPITRFIIWSCYILADWVAHLALGLLLNNMGNIGGGGGNSTSSFGLKRGGGGGTTSTTGSSNDGAGSSSSPIIFAFWTPFLLLHLGGPDTITAYSLEDNDLWLRHLVGLLFELFSAVVIIVCSVRGNRLILATTLMMAVGVIKYGERTYSRYCGSIERFRSNAAGPSDPGPNYAKLMKEFDSKEKAGLVVEFNIDGEAMEAHKEMEKQEVARRVLASDKSLELRAYEFFLIFRRLFVNLSMSFQILRLSQAFFLERGDLEPSEALGVIEMELNFVYDAMYTKSPIAHTMAGWALRCVCSGCIVSALVIFFHHDKGGIARFDVGITYALLLGAVVLDVVALAILLFSKRAAVMFQTYTNRGHRPLHWLAWLTQEVTERRWRRWSRTTSQFNLISYSLGKPDHYSGRLWHGLAKVLRLEGILEDLIFIRQVPLSELTDREEERDIGVLNFVFYGVKAAAQQLKGRKEDIMEVCNSRGKRVIERHATEIKKAIGKTNDDISKKIKAEVVVEEKFKLILDSVAKSDFDESLLLWHIATDLCLPRYYQGPEPIATAQLRHIAETLSEYMLYLLVKQPEMESARTGIWLTRYQDSCAEARRFFGYMAAWNPEHDHDDARRMLLGVNTTKKPVHVKGDRSKSVLFDAVILAKALRELDEDLMWGVVAGVWGEMLMYTANKCQGTTHVQLLNRGGELTTLVWFLMANLGLTDTCQIAEWEELKAVLIVKDQ